MRHTATVSRSTIVEQVWGLNVETMTNVVDVYVNYLRRKVDAGYDRPLIRTIRATVIKSAPANWFPSGTRKLISSSARDSASEAKKAPQNVGALFLLLTEMTLPGLLHPVRIGRQG